MKKATLEATDENILQSIKEQKGTERNTEIMEFIKALDLIEENIFISLDARWGEGKTFYVRQIEKTLEYQTLKNFETDDNKNKYEEMKPYFEKTVLEDIELGNSYLPVYYNAWLYDNHSDPLMSLLYVIIKKCGLWIDSKLVKDKTDKLKDIIKGGSNMKKKMVSVLLTASMLAGMTLCAVPVMAEDAETPENEVTGDASADDSFVVWGWNDDIKKILDGPFKEAYPDDYERIVFVNTGGSDYYQSKLDPVLDDPSNELYPDMMGLEVDYVQKYVNSDWVQNVADLGITADDYANSYQYNLDLGSDVDGNVRALFWQATPGCYAVRADLAEKYLGTTDPAALAEKFKDLDTIVATAKEVNDASGGKCKLFSGYDEIKRSLTGSRTQGFYDENDKITIDDNIKTYMETAKTLYDEDLTFNTDQWSADWSANMSGDGVDSNAALAYMGCPWFVYWSLSDAWKGNTILVPTQTKCYWGGTGLAATTDCADTELAAKIMKFFTCDEDGMVAINALNSDYVNNTAAVSKIIEAGTSADGNGYLYPDAGQNFMEFFLPLADGLDASMVTAEDQQILSLMDTQTKAYATGEKDLDTALADLTASIHDTFSYLSAE